MKLLIVSHVIHYSHQGKLYSYGPYSREIELWANLFDEVVIASPLRHEAPEGDSLEITARNVRMAPQHEGGGDDLFNKLKLLPWIPVMFLNLAIEMAKADAIHVRLPGNLGFFGAILAPLFSKKLVAKYAGPWPNLPGETKSEICQKAILASSWFRGPVTMYGDWPNTPKHVVPFFPSLLTEKQLERGKQAAANRTLTEELRVIYAGRLSDVKHVDKLVRAVDRCLKSGHKIRLTVMGDGAERKRIEGIIAELNVGHAVTMTGAVPFAQVLDALATHDVMVLASDLEGFGKALAEGMSYGMICIGPNTGIGAQLMAGRGFTVTPGNVTELTSVLEAICESPDRFALLRQRALAWSDQFTLEGLQDAIQKLLEEHWQIRLNPTPKQPIQIQQETQWNASV